MRLRGVRIAISPHSAEPVDLLIRGDRVHFPPARAEPREAVADLTGYLFLPGLINCHDHLEFGLFPKLGRHLYRNASEWAAEVYQPGESPLRELRSIPKAIRLVWGGIRNLLSGVTTVSHHNPYDAATFERNFPVRVAGEFDWAHSLAFEPGLAEKYRDRKEGRPFIVHAAEGVDEAACAEIRQLDRMGVLSAETVLIHAVGLAAGDMDILLRRGCSIVFCPNSNLATYGRTLSLKQLRAGIRVGLGTDSPITSEGDIRDDIHTARRQGLSDEEIYWMVTSAAADILQLRESAGSIQDGGVADLVAVRDAGQSPAEAIFDLHPELVVVNGRIKLVSESLAAGCLAPFVRGFQRICVESCSVGRIDADVKRLLHEAESRMPSPCRLAGKLVTA